MPSTLAPDRFGASSRRVLSRETRPPGSGEVTLSQELRTVGLLRPHVLVGYQWSHTGLCPGCRPVITATSAASCRTPSIFSMSPNQAIVSDNSIRFSPLAATQPLAILSWQEALNASGSKCPCRMAIRRKDRPCMFDSPKQLRMVSPELHLSPELHRPPRPGRPQGPSPRDESELP